MGGEREQGRTWRRAWRRVPSTAERPDLPPKRSSRMDWRRHRKLPATRVPLTRRSASNTSIPELPSRASAVRPCVDSASVLFLTLPFQAPCSHVLTTVASTRPANSRPVSQNRFFRTPPANQMAEITRIDRGMGEQSPSCSADTLAVHSRHMCFCALLLRTLGTCRYPPEETEVSQLRSVWSTSDALLGLGGVTEGQWRTRLVVTHRARPLRGRDERGQEMYVVSRDQGSVDPAVTEVHR